MQLQETCKKIAIVIPGDIFSPSPLTDRTLSNPQIEKINKWSTAYKIQIQDDMTDMKVKGVHVTAMICMLSQVTDVPVFATMGNHEWDIPELDIHARLLETYSLKPQAGKIVWLMSNVKNMHDTTFGRMTVKKCVWNGICFVGLTGGNQTRPSTDGAKIRGSKRNIELEVFPPQTNISEMDRTEFDSHRNFVILTHFLWEEDIQCWEVNKSNALLICGGHNHQRGQVPEKEIYKADSDLRSFWVHVLSSQGEKGESFFYPNDDTRGLFTNHEKAEELERYKEEWYKLFFPHGRDYRFHITTELNLKEIGKGGYKQEPHPLFMRWLNLWKTHALKLGVDPLDERMIKYNESKKFQTQQYFDTEKRKFDTSSLNILQYFEIGDTNELIVKEDESRRIKYMKIRHQK